MLSELLISAFYGILEGITEWLPISSTGHMLLFDRICALPGREAFRTLYFVAVQLGAVLAVPFCCRGWLAAIFFGGSRRLPEKPALPQSSGTDSGTHTARPDGGKVRTKPADRHEKFHTGADFLSKLFLATLPAALVGFLFDDAIERFLTGPLTIALTLILYGVVFLFSDALFARRAGRIPSLSAVTAKDALLIGAAQTLSLVPGTSRSGVTILGGLAAGATRPVSAEFSFLMAMPVMLGAGGLKLVKFLLSGVTMCTEEMLLLLIGCVAAFFTSLVAMRFLIGFVGRHGFAGFGVYRILLGIAVLLFAL